MGLMFYKKKMNFPVLRVQICFKRFKHVAGVCRTRYEYFNCSNFQQVGFFLWRTKSTTGRLKNSPKTWSRDLYAHQEKSNHSNTNIQAEDVKKSSIYTQYRTQPQKLREFRNDYFTRAERAYTQGKGALAKRLSQQGHLMNKALKSAEQKAASHILAAENCQYTNQYPTRDKMLNVHGLHVKEAVRAVRHFVDKHLEESGKVVIITGWGRNSFPDQGQLAPAMRTLLDQNGHCYEEVRPGVYEVTTHSKRYNISVKLKKLS